MRRDRGQASLELLAMVPLVLLAALLAWQLVAVIAAGLRAQEDIRARAMRATGAGEVRALAVTVPVPALLPATRGLRIEARAGVRTP